MRYRPFFRTLLFPVGLLVLGCVPGASFFLWSGHGGIGWILLPMCFPYLIVRLTFLIWKTEARARKYAASLTAAILAGYIVLAYPITRYTEHYVNSMIGKFIQEGSLFRLAIFPVGLAIPNHNARP